MNTNKMNDVSFEELDQTEGGNRADLCHTIFVVGGIAAGAAAGGLAGAIGGGAFGAMWAEAWCV